MTKVNFEMKKAHSNASIARTRKKLRVKNYRQEIIDFMNKPRPSFSPYPSQNKDITENIQSNMS